MPNKELRIIIAEANLPRRIQIEKSLNRLGYYRILPVQCFEDFVSLINAFQITFDVLIANKDLADDADRNLTVFCQTIDNVNHALLYGSQQTEMTITSLCSSNTLLFCNASVPGDELFAYFMARIDPPSPWESLKDVAWIKSVCATNKQLLTSKENETRIHCTTDQTTP